MQYYFEKTMFQLLPAKMSFPPVKFANSNGLLAYGGDLSVPRLIEAYKNGIFPWYNEEDEILWWAPNPRMVLFPEEIRISKSMRSLIKKNIYKITKNKAFEQVIKYCAKVKRNNQDGTWLHPEMQQAYIELNKAGKTFSLEVWNENNQLAGGLYVVKSNDKVWSGESMFHLEPNTSKLAFIYLAQMAQQENIEIIDCQMYTEHLASLGAKEIDRDFFMTYFET